MKIQTYHIDTFTEKLFTGNSAIVCVLEEWLPEVTLQTIAAENNQPATAFLVKDNEKYYIRWFSPEYEIPLCGHGTLAAAWVVFNILEPIKGHVEFVTKNGLLTVRNINGAVVIDFPIHQYEEIAASPILIDGLGVTPTKVFAYKKERFFALLSSEDVVKNLKPDMSLLKKLDYRGAVVTAPGSEYDFVSRVFYPNKIMFEDAVTGSAHCLLVPYWAEKLNKKLLHAHQVSPRGGDLVCELHADHITLSGKAVMYMQGFIVI
jgi:PhzF family phenazine biosynthesis protein